MTSRYYTTHANLSTRLRVLGLPTTASALALITAADGSSTSYTSTRDEDTLDIIILPQSEARYQLSIFAILDGSLVPALTAILEVSPAIPDATTTGIVVQLDATETTVAVVDVTIALLNSGGSGDWDGGTITQPLIAELTTITSQDTAGSAGIPGTVTITPDGSILSWHGDEASRCTIQGNYVQLSDGGSASAVIASGRIQLNRPVNYTPDDNDLLTRAEILALINP